MLENKDKVRQRSKKNIDTALMHKGTKNIPSVLNRLGFKSLRKGQDQIVGNVIGGMDTLGLLPTGCHAPEERIMMYSGTYMFKRAEHIEVGDTLVSEDGKPRTVTETISGTEEMYKVTFFPDKAPMVVNKSHIHPIKILDVDHQDVIFEGDVTSDELYKLNKTHSGRVIMETPKYLQPKAIKRIPFMDKLKAANIPEFIKVMGSLVYGEDFIPLFKFIDTNGVNAVQNLKDLLTGELQFSYKFDNEGTPDTCKEVVDPFDIIDRTHFWDLDFAQEIANSFIEAMCVEHSIPEYTYLKVVEHFSIGWHISVKDILNTAKSEEDANLIRKVMKDMTVSVLNGLVANTYRKTIHLVYAAFNKLDLEFKFLGYENKNVHSKVINTAGWGFSSRSSKLSNLNDAKPDRAIRHLSIRTFCIVSASGATGIFKGYKGDVVIQSTTVNPLSVNHIHVDEVWQINKSKYYGFSLKEEPYFLMFNGVKTHNTGKSACFVVPTLALEWKTIIFSPLLALMKDQVQSLWRKGISAAQIGSMQTESENINSMNKWLKGELQFLFISPERLDNNDFIKLIVKQKPDLLVCDECFTGDVEILTDKGFVRFDELTKDALCAQYDQNSTEVSFVKPTKIIQKDYTGELYTLTSDKKINLTMTAGHELLMYREDGSCKKVSVKDAKLNSRWYFKTASENKPFEGITISALDSLKVAFQADGSFHSKNNVVFSFSKQRKIDRFLKLCEEARVNVYEVKGKKSDNPNVKSRRRFMIKHDGTVTFSKRLRDMFSLRVSKAEAASIVHEAIKWDGHTPKSRKNLLYYSCTDKDNVDFLQALCVLAGYKTNQTIQVDNRKDTYSTVYRLFITVNKNQISTQNIRVVVDEVVNERVYCVRVPKGNIVVRRNGKPVITGNCHTIHQWVDSFRPSYAKIGNFIDVFNPKVVLGLTATATPDVEVEVRRVLRLQHAEKIAYMPPRTNLFLTSKAWRDDYELETFVNQIEGSTIIYCASISKVEALYQSIGQTIHGGCLMFYGEMPASMKNQNMDRFMRDEVRVMIATNAFGMGVDKPNVRAVVHRDFSGSIEALVQEAGRAGRDGKPSICLAYYSDDALKTQNFFINCKYPDPSIVHQTYNCIKKAANSKGVVVMTEKQIADRCGLIAPQVSSAMNVLRRHEVVAFVADFKKTAKIRMVKEPEDDTSRFNNYMDAIEEIGVQNDEGFWVYDPDELVSELGVTKGTIIKYIKQWITDKVVEFEPPFRGKPVKLIGSIKNVEFDRLEEKGNIEKKKLKLVLKYLDTPDNEKHDFLTNYFMSQV